MNVLTFDIEDWFHILELKETSDISKWDSYESRVENITLKIIDFLEQQNLKATFFILGWIAKKNTSLVKKIYKNGHDIGTHSFYHKLIKDMSVKEFKEDLRDSINILSDIIGDKINFYRAPGFSFNFSQNYVIEALIENNIEYDCSVFPGKRPHGGIPNLDLFKPFKIQFHGQSIKEYPLRNIRFLNKRVCITGGGYFRLFNLRLIESLTKNNDYNMFYFHPRDIDKDQPRIKISNYIRNFKVYCGLNKSLIKFNELLRRNNFLSISNYDKHYDWENAKVIDL